MSVLGKAERTVPQRVSSQATAKKCQKRYCALPWLRVILVCTDRCGPEAVASSTFITKAEFRFFFSFGIQKDVNKDSEAEAFKLPCVLTPLPVARPSSLMPEAGPSCLKPRVGAQLPVDMQTG